MYAEQQIALVAASRAARDVKSVSWNQYRGRRFATGEDIANAVRQQVTRFTHCVANAEAGGIQSLPHHWQRVVIVAGDLIEAKGRARSTVSAIMTSYKKGENVTSGKHSSGRKRKLTDRDK
ncbi:uncharacterized protein TNCV_2710351 [Trichonephila clavipes]|nr:uncharacterized protein TNCV_2710351 [Trichonephila clavipes]